MGNKPNGRADAPEDESESGMTDLEKRFIVLRAYLDSLTLMVDKTKNELFKLKELVKYSHQTTLDAFIVLETPPEALLPQHREQQTKNRPKIGQYQCSHCKEFGHNVRTCAKKKEIWWSE